MQINLIEPRAIRIGDGMTKHIQLNNQELIQLKRIIEKRLLEKSIICKDIQVTW